MAKLAVILLLALVIEAVGVVCLSHGLKQIGEMRQFSGEEVWRVIGRGLTNRYILLGTALETTFFLMLLILLKRHDVSLIWPLTSLGFVLTALAAKFIRHEEISALRWGGVVLIMIGAALIGWSERNKKAAAINPAALADAGPPSSDGFESRTGISR